MQRLHFHAMQPEAARHARTSVPHEVRAGAPRYCISRASGDISHRRPASFDVTA